MLKLAGLALAIAIVACSPWISISDAQPAHAPASADRLEPAATGEGPTMPGAGLEFEAMKYGIAQGGLALVCVVLILVIWREFVRKVEDKDARLKAEQARSDRLEEVLDRSSAAITNSAVATARQTDATHRLARTVEKLEEKMAG